MRKQILYSLFSVVLSAQLQAQIGFGTAAPNSMLDVRGGVAFSVQSFTTNITADITHHTLLFKGTTTATVSLPDATNCKGRIYYIKNASTTLPTPVVTIQPSASQTVGGFNSALLDEADETIRLVSDGANWSAFNSAVPVLATSAIGPAWYQGGNNETTMKTLGTISNNDMAFITANAERMRITSGGFLGLGGTPSGRLDIINENDDNGNDAYFDDYGTTTAGFYIRKARGTIASPANLQSADLIGQLRFSGRYNNILNRATGAGFDSYYLGSGSTNVTDLRAFTSGSEAMRLDANGNAAIGTSTFSTAVEKLVVDAGNTTSYNVISGKGSIDNYLQLNIRNSSSGSNASSDIVATADNGNESENYIDMGINSSGYTNYTYPNISGYNNAYLYSTAEDFIIGNGAPSEDLIFFTGGYALSNERLRITASGNVGIGVSNPSDKLTVAGNLVPDGNNDYSMGKSAARWTAVWSANGVIQTSDVRTKLNIHPLTVEESKVLKLKPVHYHWKSDPNGQAKIGFLAQQVQKIVPQVVMNDEKSGTLGINYSEMVPVLISLLQKQQKKLDELNKELKALEEQ